MLNNFKLQSTRGLGWNERRRAPTSGEMKYNVLFIGFWETSEGGTDFFSAQAQPKCRLYLRLNN